MKRVWIAVFLLFAITAAGIWNYFCIQNTVNELNTTLSSAYQAAERNDLSRASAHTQAALHIFEQSRGYLSLVLSHQSLDMITVSFDRTIRAAENQDFSEFMTESSELKARIRLLPESESLSFSNLF